MWIIKEHKDILKIRPRLQPEVLKKYELWKSIVSRHGPNKLKEFPGFHDEKLKGKYEDERSSRLNLQFRLIYRVDTNVTTVYSLKITPHEY